MMKNPLEHYSKRYNKASAEGDKEAEETVLRMYTLARLIYHLEVQDGRPQ